jgi:hypothetical protein
MKILLETVNSLLTTSKLKYLIYSITTVSLTLLVLLACLEMLLRSYPKLFPSWYVNTLPYNGIELSYPDILGKTPIEGVPVPHMLKTLWPKDGYFDTLPSDLEKMGIVNPQENPDPDIFFKKYSYYVLKMDNMGFPNNSELDSADIIFIGDSFAVATGIISPPGLQMKIKEATNFSIYNVGISGIGPLRQKWLLYNYGFKLRPRTVIWFFFAGNDLSDDLSIIYNKKKGIYNYAQLYSNFDYPDFYTWDMARQFLRRKINSRDNKKSSLPGLIYKSQNKDIKIWFYPYYLRTLIRSLDDWKSDPGWEITKGVFKSVAKKLSEENIKFILVYVPSKPQVYLPYVKRNDLLIHNMASFDLEKTLHISPENFFQIAMSNRNNLDLLMKQFAQKEGITYLSLTPDLEKLAKSGRLGYFSADTHWNFEGQNTVFKPIINLLADEEQLR